MSKQVMGIFGTRAFLKGEQPMQRCSGANMWSRGKLEYLNVLLDGLK